MILMIACECPAVNKHFALVHDKEMNNIRKILKFLWNETYLLYVLTYFTSLQRKFIILEGSGNPTKSAKAVCFVCFVLYVCVFSYFVVFVVARFCLEWPLLSFFSGSLMSLIYIFRIREWDGWVHLVLSASLFSRFFLTSLQGLFSFSGSDPSSTYEYQAHRKKTFVFIPLCLETYKVLEITLSLLPLLPHSEICTARKLSSLN